MKRYSIIVNVLFLGCFFAFQSSELKGQKVINWEHLADVDFEEKEDDYTGMYYLYPHFGKNVKALQGKTVDLEGYLIPVDVESNIFVLSKYPLSSCFFCGAAGPETIVEVEFQYDIEHTSMDDLTTIRGRLKLNSDDFEHFNYILSDPELVSYR